MTAGERQAMEDAEPRSGEAPTLALVRSQMTKGVRYYTTHDDAQELLSAHEVMHHYGLYGSVLHTGLPD